MRICHYEDRHAADLAPLTLTRPASDLLCGLTTLGEKQVRYFGAEGIGRLSRPGLAEWLRTRDPGTPVNDPAWLRAAPTVLVNDRWLPPHDPLPFPRHELFTGGPFVATVSGEVAFAVLDVQRLHAVTPNTVGECLADWAQSLERREVGGTLVRRAWELIDRNGEELAHDFAVACDPTAAGYHPTGFAVVGPHDRLFLHPTARVDPYVVADTTAGPVHIGAGAVVTAFTRLEGPCAIGAHTHLLSAKVRAGTTIGPHCRIGGEVECSVVLGFANKYHDGFLGHSYVGEWVNIAAGTSTGDLRFDYGPVTATVNGAEVSTGRTKLGTIFGDHAKTGLDVLLDCGTVLGPFAHLVPTGAFAPRAVPAFHRAGPGGLKGLDAERLVRTADTVMRRRGRALVPALAAVYRALAGTTEGAAADPVMIPMRKSA